MGVKTFVTLSVVVAAIGVGVVYISPDLSQKYPFITNGVDFARTKIVSYTKTLLSDDGKASIENKEASAKPTVGDRLLTPAELGKYDGSPGSLGLYLGLLGKVYDVQSGSQHYRPGGAYSFFAGRDASRAYLTGEFNEPGLTDDLTDLADDVINGITSWVDLYEKDYKYIGKLVGTYYDENGKPTAKLAKVLEAIEKAKKGEKKKQDEKQIFPPCNSEWSQETGGRVWCTKQSGGINRDWVGVPRQYKPQPSSTSQPRCACVKTTGPPSFVAQFQPATIDLTRGDLDHPHLKEYPNCSPTSESCPLEKKPLP